MGRVVKLYTLGVGVVWLQNGLNVSGNINPLPATNHG